MIRYRTIIAAYGVAAMAADLGVDDNHVRMMMTRGRIPPSRWDTVIKAARRRRLIDPNTDDAFELTAAVLGVAELAYQQAKDEPALPLAGSAA